MNPSRLFIERPVATTLLMFAILMVGVRRLSSSCRCRRCPRSIIPPSRCRPSIPAPARR